MCRHWVESSNHHKRQRGSEHGLTTIQKAKRVYACMHVTYSTFLHIVSQGFAKVNDALCTFHKHSTHWVTAAMQLSPVSSSLVTATLSSSGFILHRHIQTSNTRHTTRALVSYMEMCHNPQTQCRLWSMHGCRRLLDTAGALKAWQAVHSCWPWPKSRCSCELVCNPAVLARQQ